MMRNFLKQNQLAYDAINTSFSQTYILTAEILNVATDQINDPMKILPVYDILEANIYYNIPNPAGFTPELINNITFLNEFYWFFAYADREE